MKRLDCVSSPTCMSVLNTVLRMDLFSRGMGFVSVQCLGRVVLHQHCCKVGNISISEVLEDHAYSSSHELIIRNLVS